VGMLDEILNSIQDCGAAVDQGTQSAPGGSQGISPIAKAAPRNRRIGSRRDVRRGFPTRVALHIMGS
jgi:hypothetical protein